jgi:hypothetical protein
MYIGSELGGGPIFQVSVSQLHAKERPGTVAVNKKLAFRIRKTIVQRRAIHGFSTLRTYNVLCVVRKYCVLPGESTIELIVGRSPTNRCDDLSKFEPS